MRALNSAYLLIIPIALVFFMKSKNSAIVKKNVNVKILSMLLMLMPFIQNIYSQWLIQASGLTTYITSVNFINQSTGWAAGDGGKILKTTNGGTNWVQLTSGVTYNFNRVQFIDANSGWTSGGSFSIMRTTNGGVNWVEHNTGSAVGLYIFFADASSGWGVGANGTIYKTTNSGVNWSQQISGVTNYLTSVYFINNNTGWAGGFDGKIFKTTNGGTNWTAQVSGTDTEFFSIFFANSLTGWAVGGFGNLRSTTNGGINWTEQTSPTDDDLLSVHFINSATGWISGGNGKMLVTSNGGTNWALQSIPTSSSLNSVYFIGTYGWSCGTNGTIIATTNSGDLNNVWNIQTSGVSTHLFSVSTVNATTCWAGGVNGVVLRTTNSGTNWINVSGSPIGSNIINLVAAVDANTCIAATNTNIYKTSNAGVNWTQVFNQPGGYINDISFMNGTTGFMYGDAVGGRWSLWKTTNAGTTWDSTGLYLAQAGSELGWYNAMCISGNNIWFGTDNNRIYKSTNFGATWSFNSTSALNTYCISFSGSTGFMSSDSIVMKSTNSGNNWSGNYLSLNPTQSISAITNASGKWWICRGDTIFTSTNGGTSFAFQRKGVNRYWDMSFVTDGSTLRGWAVKNNGGIETYLETLTGAGNNTTSIPNKYMLSQNYPNPFNPITKIKFEIPAGFGNDNVKLAVFDILGREITTLINNSLQPGSYEIEFNGSAYASGVYFYRITADQFTDIKKMVLVK